ncbi:hypothetical protein C8J57DRAFT_1499761 [Mycena rebaudengoi]|nr:hypothetical protein C8J57DRAFT_1499761 [Mycena rebaudengoi]
MSLLNLPPEIVHLIVNESQDDKKVLLSCSLVSVSWLAASRSHTFANVVFTLSSPTAKTFLGLLESPFCSFTNSVRDLFFPSLRAELEFVLHAIVQLGRLSNVRTLRIQGGDTFLPEIPMPVLDTLAFTFPEITTLSVSDGFPSISDAVRFISHFIALENLDFTPYAYSTSSAPDISSSFSHVSLPPNLRSLCFRFCLHSFRGSERSFFDNFSPGKITTLSLLGLRRENSAVFHGILTVLGKQIRDLTIRFGIASGDFHVDLSNNSELRKLTIVFPRFPRQFINTLSTLSAPHLERISCYIDRVLLPSGLDELLAERRVFPSLKTFSLFHSKPTLHMPLCSALGIVIRHTQLTTE